MTGHWTTVCQTKKGIIKTKNNKTTKLDWLWCDWDSATGGSIAIQQMRDLPLLRHLGIARAENCGTFPVTTAARPYISWSASAAFFWVLGPVPHFLMGTEAMKSLPSSSLQHHVHMSSIMESIVVIIAKIWYRRGGPAQWRVDPCVLAIHRYALPYVIQHGWQGQSWSFLCSRPYRKV